MTGGVIASSRSATRLSTPSAFSSRPRTISAELVRATRRYRCHNPGEQVTLSIPVSSSRFTNVTPPAVAGRCRCVTIPPTRIRVPAFTPGSRSIGSAPTRSSCGRMNCAGCASGDRPVAHTSATSWSTSLIPGSIGASVAGHRARQAVRFVLRGRPGGPQRLTARKTETREGVGRGEGLQVSGRASGTPGQIRHAPVRPVRPPLLLDPSGQLVADRTDAGQPLPDGRAAEPPGVRRLALPALLPGRRRALQRRGGVAEVDVRPAHLDPVPPGVVDQRLRRVEAHRLGVEQRRAERRRVVALEPGADVDQVREADRVALREAVARERAQLRVEIVGERAVDPVGGHPLVEAVPHLLHLLDRPFRAHRPAQFVRLQRGEPGRVHRELHELLLKERHAQRLLQRPAHRLVRDLPRLHPVPAPDVGMHRAALDRAGPDQRHLDDQVVEHPRLEPGQRGHLGPALHLEHPDRVGPLQHPVDLGIVRSQAGEVSFESIMSNA